MIELYDAQDRVAEEVTQAQALAVGGGAGVPGRSCLRTGIITYNGTLEGLKQTSRFGGDMLVLISRPQEAVYALQMLQRAFNEYFTTVAEYNRSQFGLFHAPGIPGAGTGGNSIPWGTATGGHVAALLSASRGQWAAAGHALTHGSPIALKTAHEETERSHSVIILGSAANETIRGKRIPDDDGCGNPISATSRGRVESRLSPR